jgi:hypothetical protein
MSQETNNSDTVSTAQTTEHHDQTEVKTTIAGDQSTLTFGGQDQSTLNLLGERVEQLVAADS